ncbi:MAG TPA: glycosyltransferase, partial [Thermoanaerobaculia bacterium]|nr:glycosyltransferase [Thermoanaerobaculia bacterium]
MSASRRSVRVAVTVTSSAIFPIGGAAGSGGACGAFGASDASDARKRVRIRAESTLGTPTAYQGQRGRADPIQRIVLSTFGSLGDLHPFIAVGLGLRERGHEVVFATSDYYRAKIEGLGLELRALR